MARISATRALEAGSAAERGLELPARGGEEWRTLGQKLCPLRVFTMVGLEKERRTSNGNENVN